MQQLMTFMPLVLLIFIMYFLLIRPQKKREKAVNAMRSALKVGDNIVTIGGICGKIVKTKDETLIIQVGADKTKMEVMRWSISKVEGESPAPAKKSAVEDQDDDVEETPKKVVPKKLSKPAPASTQEAPEAPKADEPSQEIELEADTTDSAEATEEK